MKIQVCPKYLHSFLKFGAVIYEELRLQTVHIQNMSKILGSNGLKFPITYGMEFPIICTSKHYVLNTY